MAANEATAVVELGTCDMALDEEEVGYAEGELLKAEIGRPQRENR